MRRDENRFAEHCFSCGAVEVSQINRRHARLRIRQCTVDEMMLRLLQLLLQLMRRVLISLIRQTQAQAHSCRVQVHTG